MCLDTLLNSNDVINQYGYKVFSKDKNRITLPIQGTNELIPIDRWIYEKDYRLAMKCDHLFTDWSTDWSIERYDFGFHLFLKLKDAKDYRSSISQTIFLIQFKDIVAYGMQNNAPVIVAKYIKLIQEIQ